MTQPSPQVYYEVLARLFLDLFGHDWHLGYWLNAKTPEEAAQRLNELMTSRLPVTAGMTVLDVGCGVGGPACHIASATGAHVIGLSNSKSGLDEAARYTKERGVDALISYQFGEAAAMPFPDSSFDAVFSCEAIHNIEDKNPVAREIARVLKPGGTVVLGDLFLLKTPDESGPDLGQLTQFSFHLFTADDLISMLAAHGIEVYESLSIGHHVGPKSPATCAAICRDKAAKTPEGTLDRLILDRTVTATTMLAGSFTRREVSWGVWVGRKRA